MKRASRRLRYVLFCAFFLASGPWANEPVEDFDLKVVLLGTGTPIPTGPTGKFGASVLVEAAGQPYVFDCGRGCGIRLAQVYGAADYRRVDTVFISHHHGDHTVGLPEVLVSNWQARRGRPFRVWGPPYTAQLMSHLALAYAGDVALRGGDGAADAAPLQSQVTELTRDGIILEENGVTVTAFLVDHSPVEPAFGYRLDYNGRSVVISGDTLPSDNLATHAMGVDLLIHGVMSPASSDYLRESMPDNRRRAEYVISRHPSPAQAGEVFTWTRPRMAVFYHFEADLQNPGRRLIDQTRETYSGPLTVGRDLMAIYVGNRISVFDPDGRRVAPDTIAEE